MIALIDNDIILKLAKWNLLAELVRLLGGDLCKIYHLPTCFYSLCEPRRPMKALKRCGDEATIFRIKTFCEQSREIPSPKKLDWLERLNAIPNIDVGEVLIFSIGIEEQSAITYIGDKRALVALAGAPALREAIEILGGRIKCLEQIVAEMIICHGMVEVVEKVRARPETDMSLKIVFGSVQDGRRQVEILDGLRSYYNDLNKSTGGLLAAFPGIAPSVGELHRVL